MANVKVAIRVRPLSARESTEGGRIAVQVEDKVLRIQNMKQHGRPDGLPDSRGKLLEFGFDYCYWSVDPGCANYANQEEVFQDLGVSVLAGASEGYNVCLFAYGQTGTGKTYTMMGTPASMGLTPRICQGLFSTDDSLPEGPSSCRVEISFLEIYNERVRDLLRVPEQKKPNPLRVREHPEKGPYVQGLSQFVVSSYKQAVDLLEQGISNRITAATHVHDASSRSHAIFSIQYTQAIFENNLPSEIVSKINLVDLAGSERAGPHYCRDRITEGSNINKSLVTLGIVISALAQNSQMFSSCQSINSMASEGEGSTAGSQSSSLSGGGKRHCFIPYRDSVLTWLLKDSLGGNSRTIMIATVSPSCSSYSETLSTLRYAAHARNIVNKPRVNEDANVRLIRELREEIDRLKSMLLSFEMQRNPSPSLSDDQDVNISDIVLQNELQVEQLTQDWSERWRDKKELLEQYSVDINRDQAGFLIHSLLPHLIALNRDVLSTGVTFYHLREGVTKIGPQDQKEEPHIVLQGEARCEIENQCGVVTLRPVLGTVCMVNKREVTEACRLAQGAVITLGEVHKFRFNHPAEAAILRDRRRASEGVLSCGSSDLSPHTSDSRAEEDGCWERDGNKKGGLNEGAVSKQRVEEQLRYVECLREEIQAEQLRVEKDLEREQAQLRQQHRDIEQWILQEKNRLIDTEKAGTHEFGIQTDVIQVPYSEVMAFEGLEGGASEAATPPSSVVENRKRVVQEELLRHHALRRAESHVRRKRLRYQLERIARKRHLLEAKRELQRLENSLIPDSPTSHEPSSLTKTRWPPRILRRHSFSADLLSRLYPQHTPIFRHFLKRNKTLELSPSKWVSDECLPSRGMRRRANTLPSRNCPSFEAQPSFSENLMTTLTASTTKRKLSLTKSGLIRGKKEESGQNVCSVEPHYKGSKNVATFNKSSSSWSPPKGAKLSSQGNKSLERIRKMFYCSVGSGIKTALSRVFRKPPSGLGHCRGAKSINAGQFHRNIERGRTMKSEMKQSKKCPMKMTTSCEDLEKISSTREIVRRRWHSAEALTKSVIRQAREQPTYPGWMENKKEEDEEDSDSSYSVDSLSSAYATALAKQLQQEDNDLSGDENKSEPESVDSQMSQDSLGTESDGKKATVRPMLKHPLLTSHFCSNVKEKKTSDRVSTWEDGIETFSTLGPCTSNEMPAEAYWRLNCAPRRSTTNKSTKEPLSLQQSKQDTETITGEKSDDGPLILDCSPDSFSCSNVEETENILVLTDAWSSTETSDSPRIHRDSMAVRRQAVHNPVDSQSSIDCSVSLSGSESQTSLHSDCTEDKNATLEENKCWDSESDDTLLMLGDEKIIGLMDTVKTQDQEPVSCEVSHFVGSSGIVLHFDQRAELTIAVEKSGCPERREVNQNVSPEGPLCLPESAPSMVFETYHLPPDSEPEKKNLIHNEYPFCLKERKIQQICSQSDKEMQGERNREGHVLLKCNSNVPRTDCSSVESTDKILLCSMNSNSQVDSPKEYQEKQPDPVVKYITENNLNGSDNQQFPTNISTICSSSQDKRAKVITKNSVYNDLTGSPQIIFEPKFQLLFETKLESSSGHKLASEEEKVHEHVEGVVENSHCEKVLQRSKSIEPEEKEESEVGGSKSSSVKNDKKRYIPEAMTLYSLQNRQTQPMHKSLQPSDRGNASRKKRKGCLELCKCSMKMSKNSWTEEKNASAAANNGSLVNIINTSKEKRMVLTSDVSFQLKTNKVDMLEGRVHFSSGEKNTVAMPSGIEILAINPAAIIKENRNDLSPIDLKISEVVEEHMKVTMKETEEVISNDEQKAQEALTHMLTKHQKENKPCTLISNDISSLAEKPTATGPHDINDSLEILDTRDVKGHQPIPVITAPKKSHSVVQMFPHIKDDYIRIDIADVYLKEDQKGFRPKEIESEMGQGSQDDDIISYDRVNNISNALNINSRVSLHMTEEHGHTEVVLSNEQKAVMSDKNPISNVSWTVTKVQESQEVENVSATDHIMHTETVDKEGTLKLHTAKHLIVLNSGKDTEGAFTINQSISVDNYRKDLTAMTTERREEMIRKPGIEPNDNERYKQSSLCLFEDFQEYKLVDNILHKQDRPGNLIKHNCSGDNSTPTNKASSSQEREIKINISFPHVENHKSSAVLEQTCHQVSDNHGKEDCLDMQISRSTGQDKQFQANTKSSLQIQAEVSLTDETEPNILENLCHDIPTNVKHEGVNKKSTCNLNVELVQNVSEHHLNPVDNFPFDNEMYSDEQKPRAEIGFSEETSKSQYESCKLADITEILRSGKIQAPTIDCSIDGRENSQRNCVKCNSSKEKQAEENCKMICNQSLNYPCQILKGENAYQKQDYKLPVNCVVGQTVSFNNRSTQLSNFFLCSGNLDKHQDNLFKGQNYDKESCNITETATVDHCMTDLYKSEVVLNAQFIDGNDNCSFKEILEGNEKISPISSSSTQPLQSNKLSQTLKNTLSRSAICNLAKGFYSIKDENSPIEEASFAQYYTNCSSSNQAKQTAYPKHSSQVPQTLNEFSFPSCAEPPKTTQGFEEGGKNSPMTPEPSEEPQSAKKEKPSAHGILQHDLDSFAELKASYVRDKTTSRSDCTISHQCNNAENKKVKPKMFRRPNAKTAPASSTESTLDKSPEENAVPRVFLGRSSSKRDRPKVQNPYKQEEEVKSKQDQKLVSSLVHFSLKSDHALETCRESLKQSLCTSCTEHDSKTRDEEDKSQGEHSHIVHPQCTHVMTQLEKKTLPSHNENGAPLTANLSDVCYEMQKHMKRHDLSLVEQKQVLAEESQTLRKMDEAMHFASSDINPFVHPWQQKESDRVIYKHPVFGSATDLSMKAPNLEISDDKVTRCCSVDNGLNVHHSPFHSHLSTFASNKGLSSTLSSIECLKEKGQSRSNTVVKMGANDSYCSDVSLDLGNSSGKVDEFVLICSSEQESSGPLRKDHALVTSITKVAGREKKKIRHKRSSTHVPVTSVDTEKIRERNTWVSLQNMSLHLTQLLHNTSDLLGNIQCVRENDALLSPAQLSNPVSPPHSNGCNKRDSATQTAVDIGIQTEGISKPVRISDTFKVPLMEEKSKPSEVNVIVKVFGTDMLGVSQEKEEITLTLQESLLDRRANKKMKSMPDIRLGTAAERSCLLTEAVPLNVRASTPCLDTSLQSCSHFSTDDHPLFSSDHVPDQVLAQISSSSSQTVGMRKQSPRKEGALCHNAKVVKFTDRASSPILTVDAGVGTQIYRSNSTQCLVNRKTGLHKPAEENDWKQRRSQSASIFQDQMKLNLPFEKKKMSEDIFPVCVQSRKPCGFPHNESTDSVSFKNVSDQESKTGSVNLMPFRELEFQNDPRNGVDRVKRQTVNTGLPVSGLQTATLSPRLSSSSLHPNNKIIDQSNTSSVISRQPAESQLIDCRQGRRESQYKHDKDLCYRKQTLEYYQSASDNAGQCWSSPSEPSSISEGTVPLPDDDAASVALSECNTDILVNIKPLIDAPPKEHRWVPEDLPMHNKFTNWSGVNFRSPSSLSTSEVDLTSKCKNNHPDLVISESRRAKSNELNDIRMMEIEKLRQEREQVMATVCMDMNPHQLTVELTEAKLHYGLGETDAQLKLLKSGSTEKASAPPRKQQLYNSHRRSIEGLCQEREARLQTYQRARSLSPRKHTASPRHGFDQSIRNPESPSRRREFLQQLRQVVVKSTRVTAEPPRQAGQCPSEIEQLLRDYGRAREEARTEIVRARDRLRERTELEKRRLQQQTLSQVVKDDLRFRTRVSHSTLCTGSSLSLSSGPTSGYNSSNTVLLKAGGGSSQVAQVSSALENGRAQFSSRPPIKASQSLQTHRPWLSAQDVRVEATLTKNDPQLPSLLSPFGRQRTLSLSSASSKSTSYQDKAACALASVTAEVQSAADGDLGNLIAGKALNGWRCQGKERGVQAFYKPSSNPSVHSFLGAVQLERPLHSLWCMIRDHSKMYLYHQSICSAWTRPLNSSTQLVYLLTESSACHLKQPRDFCCISTESKQEDQWVVAMRSVSDEFLPRPSVDAIRGELLPSGWFLQPCVVEGREVIRVVYLLQVDLVSPAFPQRLLSLVAKKQAAVIAELDALFSI